jgi:hypothetical protein
MRKSYRLVERPGDAKPEAGVGAGPFILQAFTLVANTIRAPLRRVIRIRMAPALLRFSFLK